MNTCITSKNKDIFWQAMRAVSCIAVVLIHAKNGIAYIQQDTVSALGYFNFIYWFIARKAITFAVPLFLFMSGYFTKINNSDIAGFYKKRFVRLLIPYLIWNVIYFIWGFRNGSSEIIKFFKTLFLGQDSHLYYILVLLQLTLITPFLIKLARKKNKLVFLITPLWAIVEYYYRIHLKCEFPHDESLIFPWISYYYFGLYTRINGYPFRKNIHLAIVLFIAGLVVNISESAALYLSGMNIKLVVIQRYLGAFLYSFSIFNLLFNIYGRVKFPDRMAKIGDYSFFIYLSHIIVLNILGSIFERIPVFCDILPPFRIISAALTVILCIIADNILKKVIGEKRAQRYFGA